MFRILNLFFNQRIIMKITLDISLYPLNENFIPIIKGFIAKLESEPNITISKNNLSTQISGDYDIIMDLLKRELKDVFQQHRSVFVIKFLVGDKLND